MRKNSRYVQYWVAFSVALAAMASSVAFSWTTPVIPKFHSNETSIHMTDKQISWVVAAPSPGVMLGSLTSRYQSDKFGRRSTILTSALPFAIGTIVIMFANEAWMICLSRFLWGIGAGIIQTVAMVYIAEIADKDIRGSLTVGSRFMFNFGGFLVIAVGTFVSYETLSYMLISLPIGYFLACWWIPETPYYLLKENKVDDARKVLIKLSGIKDEKILEDKLSQMRFQVREETRRSGTFRELFTGKQYRRALIISIGLRLTQVMSGGIPIQQYLGRILQETKSGISVSTGLILFGAIRFLTCILSSTIVDRVGRRPLLIYSYIGAFITLTLVSTTFFLDEVFDITFDYFGYVIFFGIVSFCVISTLGFDTLIFVVPAEIFPLNVKSIAMTSMNLFGAIITFVGVKGYQMVKDFSGLYGVFTVFSVAALSGFIFTYMLVPETKGKSLREIQAELKGVLYEEEMVTLNKDDSVKENNGNGVKE